MANEHVLLLVDDESNIVKSLSRTLRRDGYRILTASSGQEGLDLLAVNPEIGVIVSDQRMSGMNGSEFLNKAKNLCPDAIRIMLSGYTELNSVTTAVNEGHIFKFLSKPWEDDDLRKNIEEAFKYYDLNQENKCLNEALKVLNQDLENRVNERTRELSLAMDRLLFEKTILEELNCSVIALDNNKMIVNANRSAHSIFDTNNNGLIGKAANQMLPDELLEIVITSNVVQKQNKIEYAGKTMLVCQKKSSIQALNEGIIITCMIKE